MHGRACTFVPCCCAFSQFHHQSWLWDCATREMVWSSCLAQKRKIFLTLVSAYILASLSCVSSEATSKTVSLDGRVNIPGGVSRFCDLRIVVTIDGGKEVASFCRKDGSFTVYGLPPGSHMLNVFSMGWHFPQVKLDVSSRGTGGIRAQYAEKRTLLPVPLDLRALPISYFEARKPFSLWSFVKSPTGILICISLFGIIIFPMLKVDPEEYKQMKEMWGQQGGQQQPQLQGRQKGT